VTAKARVDSNWSSRLTGADVRKTFFFSSSVSIRQNKLARLAFVPDFFASLIFLFGLLLWNLLRSSLFSRNESDDEGKKISTSSAGFEPAPSPSSPDTRRKDFIPTCRPVLSSLNPESTRAQCYKTFHGRNLQVFVIN
jgi:hypothetical protein